MIYISPGEHLSALRTWDDGQVKVFTRCRMIPPYKGNLLHIIIIIIIIIQNNVPYSTGREKIMYLLVHAE